MSKLFTHFAAKSAKIRESRCIDLEKLNPTKSKQRNHLRQALDQHQTPQRTRADNDFNTSKPQCLQYTKKTPAITLKVSPLHSSDRSRSRTTGSSVFSIIENRSAPVPTGPKLSGPYVQERPTKEVGQNFELALSHSSRHRQLHASPTR